MARYGYSMPAWLKFLIWILGLVVIWAFAMIPEAVMYGLYHLVQPESDVTRVLTLCAFWIGGGGFCVILAIVGFIATCAWTASVVED